MRHKFYEKREVVSCEILHLTARRTRNILQVPSTDSHSGSSALFDIAISGRRAALVMAGPCSIEGHCTSGSLTPSVQDRGATCQLQPPTIAGFRVANAWACHCARCLSGGGAAREVAARARRAALVVVGPCTMKGHCTSERPHSFGARPWCDVPAAGSNNQLAFAWQTRGRATAVAVSPEDAQYASLPRARAVPRWWGVAHAP